MAERIKILLFISKTSIYYKTTMDEFQKLLILFEGIQPINSEIIDVSEKPELTGQFKVDILPTIIIGDIRFIGEPKAEDILKIVKSGY